MKVLTVTPRTQGHGGHSRHKEMIRALLRAGHNVVVVAPGASDVSRIGGVEHWRTAPVAMVRPPFVAWVIEELAAMLQHRRRLREIDRVFVIYVHSLLAVLLVRACMGLRCPVVFLQRQDAPMHMRFDRAWARTRLERAALALRVSAFELMERLTLPHAELVVAQTEPLAARLARRVPHLRAIAVLPNNCRPSWTDADGPGIDAPAAAPRPTPRIGFVGNCYYRSKGLDLLVEAFRIVVARHAVELVVVGDGPDMARFRAHVADAGIAEHVSFVGRVPNAWRYMRCLDLLVAPSRLDNCPNVVLEALAANVPIVATRIDAHEFILGPDAPQLVPCEPDAIAARIERILCDPAFRDEVLAHQAVRRGKFDFDWQARVSALITAPQVGETRP